ncbi:MAG: T9SS type A sorting domain-containing protein, partial [Bacteroidales bacterium]|nr:T9SS type A sorting domain-containing protein [Bacteroidales bacterium]
DGRKMLEQEVGGISAIVDISTLEKGTYIAAIYLAEGVTTKKLIVE